MCQEGAFIIDNVSFYPSAQVGTELTAEADWKRRGLYIGPQFDTLDVGVQEELEKFLAERGINESLALFVPEFAEYKEQKVSARPTDVRHSLTVASCFTGVRAVVGEREEVC
jgi:complement component 1 Q subcomponent-binding protein, mitochondrial